MLRPDETRGTYVERRANTPEKPQGPQQKALRHPELQQNETGLDKIDRNRPLHSPWFRSQTGGDRTTA